VIDGVTRDTKVIAFDGGIDGKLVADPLQAAFGAEAAFHRRRPERREIVQVHVGVDGDVGLDVGRLGQRAGQAEPRIVHRSREGVDGDVERGRHAQDTVHPAERDGARFAPPRAAGGGEGDRALSDGAGERDVADDERSLLRGAEDDRASVHPEVVHDEGLIERLAGIARRARPHLEDRLLDLDHAE
jgi:hypothetical protein